MRICFPFFLVVVLRVSTHFSNLIECVPHVCHTLRTGVDINSGLIEHAQSVLNVLKGEGMITFSAADGVADLHGIIGKDPFDTIIVTPALPGGRQCTYLSLSLSLFLFISLSLDCQKQNSTSDGGLHSIPTHSIGTVLPRSRTRRKTHCSNGGAFPDKKTSHQTVTIAKQKATASSGLTWYSFPYIVETG